MFEYLTHLKVFQYDNKIRLGRNADGGYVIADIGGYDAYISCGIGGDDSVSNAVIDKFKISNNFAYDGTIAEYPKNGYSGMNFFKKNIGATNTDKTSNLKDILERYSDILIKMDIEGGEYNWIDSLSTSELLSIKQLVIEFHGVNPNAPHKDWGCLNSKKPSLFEKLTKTHSLIHAHGNNFSKLSQTDNIKVPDVIELTYVRKDVMNGQFSLNKTPLPIKDLDYPNYHLNPEIDLSFPPFTN
jgi:hypothetical protein